MKIVQISTNSVPVPPLDYGGKQRDIYYLTEDLIRRGHEVILYAKKGSKSSALTYEYPSDDPEEQLNFIIRTLPDDVDMIHDHYGIAARANPPFPTIRNAHGDKRVSGQICVYVSKHILKTVGQNMGYYVHNGIGLDDYKFRTKKQKYLLFIGRIARIKGVHLAIRAAKKTGKRLTIAGPIRNKKDEQYFLSEIKPHLNKKITYVGSVGGKKKQKLLSRAYCVLFPSIWNEPFGLVPIEALACGTPVLALKNGAIPEVLNGFPHLLCRNTKEMIKKIKSGKHFPPPEKCRKYVKGKFSDRVMTDHFLKLYQKILREHKYVLDQQSEWMKRQEKLRSQV